MLLIRSLAPELGRGGRPLTSTIVKLTTLLSTPLPLFFIQTVVRSIFAQTGRLNGKSQYYKRSKSFGSLIGKKRLLLLLLPRIKGNPLKIRILMNLIGLLKI